MPLPLADVPPALAEHLADLERRIEELEAPNGPLPPLYPTLKANLPAAASNIYRVAYCTDLVIPVFSDGTNWRRFDTGAVA